MTRRDRSPARCQSSTGPTRRREAVGPGAVRAAGWTQRSDEESLRGLHLELDVHFPLLFERLDLAVGLDRSGDLAVGHLEIGRLDLPDGREPRHLVGRVAHL